MTEPRSRRVTRQLHLVDRDTGQVTEGDATWEEPGKRGRKGKKMTFAMLHTAPDGIGRLDLTGQGWRVLMQIIAATSAETHTARISVNEIADNLGIAASNASRGLSGLIDRRIVFRLRQGHYRVNTHIAYRGSAEDWGQDYYSDPEPIWKVEGT